MVDIRAPGVDDTQVDALLRLIREQAFVYAGAGSGNRLYQEALTEFDRFGVNIALPNHETSGITFITRPEINLDTSSVRQDNILATLDDKGPDTIAFHLRCMLDARLAKEPKSILRTNADKSRIINNDSPFINMLTNSFVSIQGAPDYILDTETSEGGFFGEDQTLALGSNRGNATSEVSISFKEIHGGIIRALFYYWVRWMDMSQLGTVVPYPYYIAARKLSYTCSIYRFILDPSKRTITAWAKYTGCFPKLGMSGAIFNVGEAEHYLSSAMTVTIPFTVNHVEYMNPLIFRDFNKLMRKFAGDYTSTKVLVPPEAEYNFKGLPYIDEYGGLNELQFYADESELVDPLEPAIASVRNNIAESIRARIQQDESPLVNSPEILPEGTFDV